MKNAIESRLGFTSALVTPQGLCAGYSAKKQSGFTLIELLVVVLIIGILAAVALPQYQKAVEKSKTAEALSLVKTVGQASLLYYLSTGQVPTSFEQLDVDLPSVEVSSYDRNKAQGFFAGGDDPHRFVSRDWGIYLRGRGPVVLRLSGEYAYKAGFAFEVGDTFTSQSGHTISAGSLWCITGNNLNYCAKIMQIDTSVYFFSRGTATYHPLD